MIVFFSRALLYFLIWFGALASKDGFCQELKADQPEEDYDEGFQIEEVEAEGEERGESKAENETSDPWLGAKFKVRIAFAKPTFSDLGRYDKFYGETSYYPMLGLDYFFYDWFVNLGLGLRLGYYTDRGYPVNGISDPEPDKTSKTELQMVPLQVHVAGEINPFPQKWIQLEGWVGYRYYQIQEIRVNSSTATSESSETTAATSSKFVNKLDEENMVLGGAISIRLDRLDTTSTGVNTIDLRGIFVSPYMEALSPLKDKPFNLGGVHYGLMFSFEII